jgi:hypothetical protein
MRPEHAGWWDVFSVAQDPPLPEEAREQAERLETKAVAAIACDLGGFAAGPGGGAAKTILRSFSRVGLVHELDAQRAGELRRALVGAATGPSAQPPPTAPPLRHTRHRNGRAEVLAAAQVARRVEAGDDLLPSGGEHGDDLDSLLGDLFDAAMHQGTCYPHTAGTAPLFAALAADDRLCDFHRAWLLLDLYLIATVGRRDLCAMADELRALGTPAVETPDAAAARAAVAAALPALAARWPVESELGRFFLAALAGACPEAAPSLRAEIEGLASRHTGTDRAAALALIRGLASADAPVIEAALDALASWAPQLFDDCDSPYAATDHRALHVLEDLLMAELGRVAS